MQVVILAGGLGTRLRPITQRIPKPMVEVAGEPFLAYIIRFLVAQDFRRLLLLVGYLGDQVEAFFGNGSRYGASIDYAYEPMPLGTGGAIRNAYGQLDDEFLMLYGDSYLPIDYSDVANTFNSAASQALMVVYDNAGQNTGVPNNVAVDPCGQIVRYSKREYTPDLNYVEAGVLCFRRSIFDNIPKNKVVSLEEELYPRLIQERQIHAFVTRQRFFDIGTQARLQEFSTALL